MSVSNKETHWNELNEVTENLPVLVTGKNRKEVVMKKANWRKLFGALFDLFFGGQHLWVHKSPNEAPKEFGQVYEFEKWQSQHWNF